MSTLTDRLRSVLGTPAGRHPSPPRTPVPAADLLTDGESHDTVPDLPEDVRPGEGARGTVSRSAARTAADRAADVLGGSWCDALGQRFLVIDRTYTPGHRHGRLAIADVLPPPGAPWPSLGLLGEVDPAGGMLFLDLETTGLAGGAGTYAFLVGCAWFDGGVLRVRQYFLSSFAGERALLSTVAALAGQPGTIVTYNGKTFDVPLLETRFVLHRMAAPFGGRPHVDMLHPARRLWRGEEDEAAGTTSSCRLSLLEETLLGHVREGDVPGFEIPERYFHYVRTGDARPLEPVLEHNRLDLVSLACVTARAAALLEQGVDDAETGREAYGLGRLYERAGRLPDARSCYARAAGVGDAPPLRADWRTRAEALRAYALLARRERRHDDAAEAWERVVALRRCPPAITRQAIEALAVHHEHRRRDPHAARAFALRSLALSGTQARRSAVTHRIDRLERKLGGDAGAEAGLFEPAAGTAGTGSGTNSGLGTRTGSGSGTARRGAPRSVASAPELSEPQTAQPQAARGPATHAQTTEEGTTPC